jgi:tripartite-type tricarboxylate transporter receptor subunit TctC
LHESFVKTLADPGMREKMVGRGADPVGNTPDQFAAFLREDMQGWAKIAKASGITMD